MQTRSGRSGWEKTVARARWLRLRWPAGLSGRDAVAIVVAISATAAILINMMMMQPGAHPAPMFNPTQSHATTPPQVPSTLPGPPRSRPADPLIQAPSKVTSGPRTPGEIINDIQRELARRGYYDGAIDGVYGPKTDGAIREFEQAAGLKPSTEPNEGLLHSIQRAPTKPTRAPAASGRPPTASRSEITPDRPAPSRRLVALQRALAEFGYGQIKPTGILDAETQAAIEKFERERKLPVTGQASERVIRELGAMIGRPLE